jgi:integrase
MTSFSKVSERDKLKARRDPYWQKISKGCYLGFRKMTAGSVGTWSARFADSTSGKQVYKILEDITDLADHQRYDAAQKAAQTWFEHLGKGGSAQITTLADACNNYVTHLKESKGNAAAANASIRFRNYVLNHKKLSSTELSKLTPANIADWRKSVRDKPTISGPNIGNQRSDSTLNRDMTCLRAALNHAYKDGLVTTDFAWRSKLVPIKNADKKREIYLDVGQRRMLIEHAQPDLAVLLKALSLLPLRPGAVAALCVKNYDKRLGVLTIGKDKAGRDRKISLPASTAAFFTEHTIGKLPATALIARSDGSFWNKDAWKRVFKKAAKAANLQPTTTAYALRHSTITDLIALHRLDTMTVAQLSGTSLSMIEKHYGHLLSEHAAKALAGLAL